MLDAVRIQVPLATLAAGTYNNAQGKTIKGVGRAIVFSKPDYSSADDYTQRLYMILGRAQALECSLFCNLPEMPEGDIDFSIFQTNPPACIAEFEEARRHLPGFPATEHLPRPTQRVAFSTPQGLGRRL